MSNPIPPITATEISQLAGVTRATVSNWRRRHADFPQPIGGTENRPVFHLGEVQAWLSGRGKETVESPITQLRTLLRAADSVDQLLDVMRRLELTSAGWRLEGRGNPAGFALELLHAMNAVAEVEGSRAALDALAERVLEEGAVGGTYVTPEPVADFMAALAVADKQAFDSVLDPACGSGALLVAAARHGATELYGQDVLVSQVLRTRLTIAAEAHGAHVATMADTPITSLAPTVEIRVGDSVLADAFPALDVDAVLCNPPSAQRDWGSEELTLDDTRWDYGVPPRGESELAWVQLALAHLRPGGTAALLLPPAVAARSSGRRIRGSLLRDGALRAVIGLPAGVAQPWQLGLHVWVLRRPEPGVPAPDTVLFADVAELRQTSGDGIDWAVVTDTVITSWRAYLEGRIDAATVPGVATAVRVVDVLDDDIDLTPARHVRTSLDPAAMSDEIDEAIERLDTAVAGLAAAVSALGRSPLAAGKAWRTATISDLANGGAVQFFRSCTPTSESDSNLAEKLNTRRVLTAGDVANGGPASGTLDTAAPSEVIEIQAGDVLIPAVRSGRTGGRNARVAGLEDAGAIRGAHVYLLRPHPARLDSWFLAGFVSGVDNTPITRTSTIRFDPVRMRIPLLPLAEQQRYGASFHRLHTLRTAIRKADDAAEQVAGLVTTGYTAGALAPPDDTTTTDTKKSNSWGGSE